MSNHADDFTAFQYQVEAVYDLDVFAVGIGVRFRQVENLNVPSFGPYL